MRHYADYSKVRAEVFPNADIASATVISPGFVNPDALIEIETIAVVGSGPSAFQMSIQPVGVSAADNFMVRAVLITPTTEKKVT